MVPRRACLLAWLALACVLGGGLGQDREAEEEEQGEPLLPPAPLAADAPEAVLAAEFVLAELQQLSDSGVYETLRLAHVVDAATQDGVFHHNTFLTLELASPHFLSGNATERFDVMVMRHFEDRTYSFAIDEFPEMTDEAIEAFWVRMVERHREQREEAFRQLEASLDHDDLDPDSAGKAAHPDMRGMSAEQLLHVLAQDDDAVRLQAALDIFDGRWEARAKVEDPYEELSHMRTHLLHEVATNPATEPERRDVAKRVLDERAAVLDAQWKDTTTVAKGAGGEL